MYIQITAVYKRKYLKLFNRLNYNNINRIIEIKYTILFEIIQPDPFYYYFNNLKTLPQRLK